MKQMPCLLPNDYIFVWRKLQMAAVDYFLKIEGIDGESADAKHKNEIDLDSWSWGESQGGTMSAGGGGGAGKVQMQDFHFTMKVNKSSPKLILACATGEHIKKGVLTCRKAGKEQQEFLKITFTDLLISSYQIGGASSGSTLPNDQIAFNYAKIEIEYKEQKADGTLGGPIKVGYDLKANKKI
jgi:type VI secretion system secreted protein Hcp